MHQSRDLVSRKQARCPFIYFAQAKDSARVIHFVNSCAASYAAPQLSRGVVVFIKYAVQITTSRLPLLRILEIVQRTIPTGIIANNRDATFARSLLSIIFILTLSFCCSLARFVSTNGFQSLLSESCHSRVNTPSFLPFYFFNSIISTIVCGGFKGSGTFSMNNSVRVERLKVALEKWTRGEKSKNCYTFY